MQTGFPIARSGEVIGLLGGSFDPAHEGHAHITREALKRFGLDRIWWLVTPANPLKAKGPAPLATRMERARSIMRHPRVEVTCLEAHLRTRATVDTITALRARYPGVHFVWLMGADNLAQFHEWQDWRQIAAQVPLGIIARPGDRISARTSPAARYLARYRLAGTASHLLARSDAPAWCFVNVPMLAISSTALRSQGVWRAAAAAS